MDKRELQDIQAAWERRFAGPVVCFSGLRGVLSRFNGVFKLKGERSMSSVDKFNLGDRVKDVVTGFTGIAVCRTEWMNKCVRYGVAPEKLGKENKLQEAQYFDQEQLVLVKALAIKVHQEKKDFSGGPKPAPQRQQDPRS